MRQLLEAIKHLRQHRVLHRNISLNHIFLDDDMQVKLADFYFAIQLDDGKFVRRNSDCGLTEYKCPEFFKNKGYSYE